MKHISIQLLARLTVVVFAVVAASLAIKHGGRGEESGAIAPLEREQADTLASELARCRAVTSNETSALEGCRRIWADNRRLFFRPASSRSSVVDGPTTPSPPLKIQDRLTPPRFEPQPGEIR
jgi:conjugative transfer region protein TrbK